MSKVLIIIMNFIPHWVAVVAGLKLEDGIRLRFNKSVVDGVLAASDPASRTTSIFRWFDSHCLPFGLLILFRISTKVNR